MVLTGNIGGRGRGWRRAGRGGAGGRKRPRDGGGGVRGTRRRTNNEGGAKRSKSGAARGTTETKYTTATSMSRRKRLTEDPSVRTHDDGTGGKYRMSGTRLEESVDESAEWSEEEIEELE